MKLKSQTDPKAEAFARLENVGVSIPIFKDGASRSLRGTIAAGKVGALVNKSHGSITTVDALRNVSIHLNVGDVCGLVGYNGAGKSTLLKVLSGAYIPTNGKVEVHGQSLTLMNIALGMDPDLSGMENIFIRGVMLGFSKRRIEQHIEDIVAFTELGDYIDLPVRTYSAGMGLRLMFAICTSFPSDLLLIDEVIGVGDASFYGKASKRLQKRIDESAIAVIASHSTDILRQFCNRMLWLDQGTIRADGLVDDVIEAYAKHTRDRS